MSLLLSFRFEMIQKLETYGCVKWKSISVPNCKKDVLLVYSDQRDNVDQIGMNTTNRDTTSVTDLFMLSFQEVEKAWPKLIKKIMVSGVSGRFMPSSVSSSQACTPFRTIEKDSRHRSSRFTIRIKSTQPSVQT